MLGQECVYSKLSLCWVVAVSKSTVGCGVAVSISTSMCLRFDALAVHDVELHHSLRVEMFWDEMMDTGEVVKCSEETPEYAFVRFNLNK